MKNKKKFFIDVVQNTFAFGIYIGTFHLLLMPYLARNLQININAQLLIYIMISNILTMSLGNELGILYQVISGRRPNDNNSSDIRKLSFITNVILTIIMTVLLLSFKFSLIDTLALTIITILTNTRFYIQGYLRLNKKFTTIGFGNLFYLVGVIFSILIAKLFGLVYWLPLLLAEIFSVIYIYIKTTNFRKDKVVVTKNYKSTMREYIELIGSTLLTNIPIYADKLLVLPLLGDRTMSAYYAGTVVSKILFLVINPINGVLLSWLVTDKEMDEKEVIKGQLRVNIVVYIIVFIISIPMTFIMIKIFYNQFFDQVIAVIVPLSLISAFSIASSLLRVVFIRYFDLKKLKYYNLVHIISFLVFALVGAKINGLLGFTYGVALSKGVLWSIFFMKLLNKSKKQRDESVLASRA